MARNTTSIRSAFDKARIFRRFFCPYARLLAVSPVSIQPVVTGFGDRIWSRRSDWLAQG